MRLMPLIRRVAKFRRTINWFIWVSVMFLFFGIEEVDVEERGTEFLLDTEEDGPLVMAKDNSEIRGWNDLWEQIKEDL